MPRKKIKFGSSGEGKAFKRGFAIGAEVCRTKGAAGIRSHKGGGTLIAKAAKKSTKKKAVKKTAKRKIVRKAAKRKKK